MPAGQDLKAAEVDLVTVDAVTGGSMKATKTTSQKKDLPAKSSGTVKGGGLTTLNDNITLLRHAKPTVKKKDLPAAKDVKGGKKRAS
jgi:hypothetical protein